MPTPHRSYRVMTNSYIVVGNTDVYNASQPYSNLPLAVVVNGYELEPWVIPCALFIDLIGSLLMQLCYSYYHSSSCGVRSGITCYQISNKFVFPATYLTSGLNATNTIVLSLPYNATDYESALLPRSVYVQYDALRLEVL